MSWRPPGQLILRTRIVEMESLFGESFTHSLQFLLFALRRVMRTETITRFALCNTVDVTDGLLHPA
jgi:hypothetical protein